jgi:hypothetical protein
MKRSLLVLGTMVVYTRYTRIPGSNRVKVIVLNIVKLDNKTAIAKEFGSQRI